MKLLFEQKDGYLTGKELAFAIKTSSKTMRKDLASLDTILKDKKLAMIKAKRGNGYQLKVIDKEAFVTFYLAEIKEQATIADIKEAKDRQHYILNCLLLEQREIYVDDLASELYVSRSTISNDLAEIRKLVKAHHLNLKSKSNRGIYLVGDEQKIRHFIINYFFDERLHDDFFAFSKYAGLLDGVVIDDIVLIVLEECRKAKLKLSDMIVYNLVLHLALAIKRLKNGFDIGLHVPMIFEKDACEYQTALKILARIEEKLQIAFPIEEAEFVALHLRAEAVTTTVLTKSKFTKEELREQLQTVLCKIDKVTTFDFTHDRILLDGLSLHFTPLLVRLQNDDVLENPLLLEIKEKQGELFEMTIKYFSEMPLLKQYHMTEGEWAYLTLHLIAAVERHYNAQKVRVVVICATGLGSAQMLKNRLEHEFGSRLVIQAVISYYELAEQDISEIDLIISAVNLPNIVLRVPIINVSVFLTEDDIKKVNRALKNDQIPKCLAYEQQQNNAYLDQEVLTQGLRPELCYFTKKHHTKKEVLQELIARIEKLEKRELQQEFFKQLEIREAYGSVIFSPYMAVPHPIEALTQKGYVAVAIVPNGVTWSKMQTNIQLVFLLSPDKLGSFPIDKVSQVLTQVMEDDEFRKKLVASRNYQEFIKVFSAQIKNGERRGADGTTKNSRSSL